jgi:hypothetical protein
MPSSARLPPSGGPSITGASQVAEPQDIVEAQPSDEAVGGNGVPVTGAAIAAGATAQAAAGDGHPTSEVLPGGATNVTTEEVAADDPTSSVGPSGDACFSPEMADDDGAVEHEVILGHPMLRAPGDVSLDEAMGTVRWALTQAQNVLHWERGGIVDEQRRLVLWASLLKEWTTMERAGERLGSSTMT